MDYEQLTRIKRSAYAQVSNKSVKIREVNFKTYPLVEPLNEIGYNLLIRDESGNVIKSQYHKWKTWGQNNMDYGAFDSAVKAKNAANKFLSIQIGESAEYEFTGMKLVNQMNNFSHEPEEVWLVSLKGVDPELPEERKNWTVSSVKVFNQFKDQDINEGDRILISREPKGDKSTYIVKKLSVK
jgi:hypothetical protein